MNPAEKAIAALGGPSTVAVAFGISRQAVNSWAQADKGVPTYFIRALAAVSGVPIEEFLAHEEKKKGIDAKAVTRRLKEVFEDRNG